MDSLSRHRWSLAFVAFRWRHVLWLLPVGGLLIGGVIEWHKTRPRRQSIAVISLPAEWMPDAPSPATPGLREFKGRALSDDLLEAVVSDCDFPVDHRSKEEGVTKLRNLVVIERRRGTTQVEIRIKGKKTTHSDRACEALSKRLAKQVGDWHDSPEEKAYAELKSRLSWLEKRWSEKTGKLTKTPDLPDREALLAEVQSLEKEWKRLSLDIHLSPVRMRINHAFGSPYIKALPGPAPPFTWRDGLKPAADIGTWTGKSMLLAVLLAYVLELMLPRRGPGRHPEELRA